MDHYYEIKAGIGLNKSPELYGAFPTDAYSHTPGNAGAKQPGMTGQVKEDVISRITELGITVRNGEIVFNTSLFNRQELLVHSSNFEYFNLQGEKQILNLQPNQLAFTFCQVPIIYILKSPHQVRVVFHNGEQKILTTNKLDKDLSAKLFNRTGEVVLIEMAIGIE